MDTVVYGYGYLWIYECGYVKGEIIRIWTSGYGQVADMAIMDKATYGYGSLWIWYDVDMEKFS